MATVTVTRDDALAAMGPRPAAGLARRIAVAVPAPREAEEAAGEHGPEAGAAEVPGVAVAAAPGVLAAAVQAEAPAREAAGQAPPAETAQTRLWVRLLIAIAAIAAVLLAWAITVHFTHDPAVRFGSLMPKPVNGTTIFAVFFVASAAIERFLEPISGLLPDKSDLRQEAHDAKARAGREFVHGQDAATASTMLKHAARKEADAKDWVFGETVGFWALATIISVVASAALKLYLPYVVGIATGGRPIQILATGLIIGGGTKPLHELVGYMSAAKEAKQAAK